MNQEPTDTKMKRRDTVKDDGRSLYFYTFGPAEETAPGDSHGKANDEEGSSVSTRSSEENKHV